MPITKRALTAILMTSFKLLNAIKRKVSLDNPINPLLAYAYLRAHGIECDYGQIRLQGFPIIQRAPGSSIKITGPIHLISKSEYNVAGINHPCIISTTSSKASIQIAGPFGASGCAIIASNSIKIGRNVSLGVNTKIYDTDFHPVNPDDRLKPNYTGFVKTAPIEIEESVWICANCTVLKNVRIGKNSVIGANSLVVNNVPENSVFGNQPSQLVYSMANELN